MSYPAFLLIAISVAVILAAALAGPLSALCIIGFWAAHYFFVEWSLNSAPLHAMSDAELVRILGDWTKRGFTYYSPSQLKHVLKSGDKERIDKAIRRVLSIYDEVIRRYEKVGINADNYRAERHGLESTYLSVRAQR